MRCNFVMNRRYNSVLSHEPKAFAHEFNQLPKWYTVESPCETPNLDPDHWDMVSWWFPLRKTHHLFGSRSAIFDWTGWWRLGHWGWAYTSAKHKKHLLQGFPFLVGYITAFSSHHQVVVFMSSFLPCGLFRKPLNYQHSLHIISTYPRLSHVDILGFLGQLAAGFDPGSFSFSWPSRSMRSCIPTAQVSSGTWELVTVQWKFDLDVKYVTNLTARNGQCHKWFYIRVFMVMTSRDNWDGIGDMQPKNQLTINRSLEERIW